MVHVKMDRTGSRIFQTIPHLGPGLSEIEIRFDVSEVRLIVVAEGDKCQQQSGFVGGLACCVSFPVRIDIQDLQLPYEPVDGPLPLH